MGNKGTEEVTPDSCTATLNALLEALPSLSCQHAPGSALYRLLKQVARGEVEGLFSGEAPQDRNFGPFGKLAFPYETMGAVSSLNLFDLDELILFSFYWTNRDRYRRVLDVGANLGLHSIIMDRCGFEVKTYEPDPEHFRKLQRNLSLNRCSHVQAYNAAVSGEAGVMEFVRVLGNTTGSHLAGSKTEAYGDLERFPVRVESIESLISWADLIKLDVEGHEKRVLLATKREHWLNTEALVEVGQESNATAIFDHFTSMGVKLFSQKTNWQAVKDAGDMPTSYREGSLFITCRDLVPWSATGGPP